MLKKPLPSFVILTKHESSQQTKAAQTLLLGVASQEEFYSLYPLAQLYVCMAVVPYILITHHST